MVRTKKNKVTKKEKGKIRKFEIARKIKKRKKGKLKEKFERRKRIERRSGERGGWGEKFERRRNLNLISKRRKRKMIRTKKNKVRKREKGKI